MSEGPSTEKERSPARLALGFTFVRLRVVAVLVLAAVIVAKWDRIRDSVAAMTRPDPGVRQPQPGDEHFCPMHPTVVQREPGACPSCNMPLARRTPGPRAQLRLRPGQIAQGGIATDLVRKEPLEAVLEIPGALELDERARVHVAARMAGRLDRLNVPLVGGFVSGGQTVAWIWNREASTALRERREVEDALAGLIRDRAPVAAIESARAALEPVRAKLKALGLQEEAASMAHGHGTIKRPAALDLPYHIEERAPLQGRVLKVHATVGHHVTEGADLLELVDDRRLVFVGQLGPDDARLARLGVPLAVKVRGVAEEVFTTLAVVDARADAATRTLRIAAEVPNPQGDLRAGTPAVATARVPLGGVVPERDPRPPGRYYGCCESCDVVAAKPGDCPQCPMKLTERAVPAGRALAFACPIHADVEEPREGPCGRCGLARVAKLVPSLGRHERRWGCFQAHATELASREGPCAVCGRARVPIAIRPSLSVAASAVVASGRRTVVWRQVEPGVFEPREVKLGPRAGDRFEVVAGLAEGDRVAATGAFLLDAEARLDPAAGTGWFGASKPEDR